MTVGRLPKAIIGRLRPHGVGPPSVHMEGRNVGPPFCGKTFRSSMRTNDGFPSFGPRIIVPP